MKKNGVLYIVSDDNYFSLGAKEVLTQSGYQVAIIDTKRLLRLDTFIKLQHEDTILLSSENEDLSQITLFLAIASNVKIIHSISGNVPSDIWKKGILSKKTAIHEFPCFTKYLLSQKYKFNSIELTSREVEIIGDLLKGKKNHEISKEMKISEKTVSAHKINALKKLGLIRLNSRAIVIYTNHHNLLQSRTKQ